MKSIRANGLEIYYRESDKVNPWCSFTAGRSLQAPRKSSADLRERFRVLAPDSRGHGKTHNPAGHLDYRQMADDIAALSRHWAWRSRWSLGEATGGRLPSSWACAIGD